MMTTFDFRRSDHQRSRGDSLCLSEIDDFLRESEPFLQQDMHLDLFDNILENEDFKSAFGSIVESDLFESVEIEDDVDVVTVNAESQLVDSLSSWGSHTPEPVESQLTSESCPTPDFLPLRPQVVEQIVPVDEISTREKKTSKEERRRLKEEKKLKKLRRREKEEKRLKKEKLKKTAKSEKLERESKTSPASSESKSKSDAVWVGAHSSTRKDFDFLGIETERVKPQRIVKSSNGAQQRSSDKKVKPIKPSLVQGETKPKTPDVAKYRIPKVQAAPAPACPRRQAILLPVLPSPVANKRIVSLDHDYCSKYGVEDDFSVCPMDLEPENERGTAKIEVLPDLSFAKEKAPATPSPRSLLKVNQPKIEADPPYPAEESLMVQVEEVVTTTEDSGLDVGGDGDRRSRRRYRNRDRSSSYSSSESESDRSRDGREKFKRYRDRSRSRSQRGRSRRGTSKSSYMSSGRSRSRSRCSSPEYRQPPRMDAVKAKRRNIWMDAPQPQMTRPVMKKTPMNEALDKIKRGGDRKVIYVGRIPDGTDREAFRGWFSRFGKVEEVSLHFRDVGENYGFVTYEFAEDAYRAVERGCEDPDICKFQLCFGGRRQFCGQQWQDLDGHLEKNYMDGGGGNDLDKNSTEFDALLKSMRKRY